MISFNALLDGVTGKTTITNLLIEYLVASLFYFILFAWACRTAINYKAHASRRNLRAAKSDLTSANMDLATTKVSAEGTASLVRQARARLNEVRDQACGANSRKLDFALEQIEEAYEWAQDCNDKANRLVREQQMDQIKASVKFGEKERACQSWEKLEAMSLLGALSMVSAEACAAVKLIA